MAYVILYGYLKNSFQENNVILNANVYLLQGKWEVPLPKVRAQGETEVLKVIKTGKRQKKAWKRMVTKVCFVGDGFTRKPPKYERFIRPMVGTKYT